MVDTMTIVELVLQAIGFATLIIQLIPTLNKNHWLKPALEFIGKYVALNKPVIRDYVDFAVAKWHKK